MSCNVLSLSSDSINDPFLNKSQEIGLRKSQEIESKHIPVNEVAKVVMKSFHGGSQCIRRSSDFKVEKEEAEGKNSFHFQMLATENSSVKDLFGHAQLVLLQKQPELTVDFKTEFEQLRKETQALYAEIDTKTNRPKIEMLAYSFNSCRFDDISCPLATWVGIGSAHQVYLHANYVTLADATCIATQYPLLLSFFWEFCEKDALIVDLTNQGDMQKGLVSYVPLSKGEILKKSGTTITCTDETSLASNLMEYRYQGSDGKKELEVRRIHYKGWNDQRGIEDRLNELNQLVDLVEEAVSQKQQVIVHCRAGVGRTGTVLVAVALKRLIKQGKVDTTNFSQVVRDLILEIRKQRGPECVQVIAQYYTIWESGKNWLKTYSS